LTTRTQSQADRKKSEKVEAKGKIIKTQGGGKTDGEVTRAKSFESSYVKVEKEEGPIPCMTIKKKKFLSLVALEEKPKLKHIRQQQLTRRVPQKRERSAAQSRNYPI